MSEHQKELVQLLTLLKSQKKRNKSHLKQSLKGEKMFTLHILGSGSAWESLKYNYHSNFALKTDGGYLLVDAGAQIMDALLDAEIAEEKIHGIFITHLHGDHCHGLEYLGFKNYLSRMHIDPTFPKYRLYIAHALITPLWENILSGTMQILSEKRVTLQDYFDVVPLEDNRTFFLGNISLTPRKTKHVYDGKNEIPAYGLAISDEETSLYISGDVRMDAKSAEYTVKHLTCYDHIFHECEFKTYENSLHSQYRYLRTLHPEIKKRTYLYHYGMRDLYAYFETTDREVIEKKIKKEFAGLLKRGEVIDVV